MPILLQEDLERPLPPMYWVRQQFNDEVLTDVVGAVKEQLARPEVAGLVKPGARVAVAVGSRGIRDRLWHHRGEAGHPRGHHGGHRAAGPCGQRTAHLV